MRKLILFLSFVLSLSLLPSCVTSPPDVAVCTELDVNRGYCVMTISSTEFFVDNTHPYQGKTWWDMRPYTVIVPADSWAKIKAFVLKVCAQTTTCKDGVGDWQSATQSLDGQIKKP